MRHHNIAERQETYSKDSIKCVLQSKFLFTAVKKSSRTSTIVSNHLMEFRFLYSLPGNIPRKNYDILYRLWIWKIFQSCFFFNARITQKCSKIIRHKMYRERQRVVKLFFCCFLCPYKGLGGLRNVTSFFEKVTVHYIENK